MESKKSQTNTKININFKLIRIAIGGTVIGAHSIAYNNVRRICLWRCKPHVSHWICNARAAICVVIISHNNWLFILISSSIWVGCWCVRIGIGLLWFNLGSALPLLRWLSSFLALLCQCSRVCVLLRFALICDEWIWIELNKVDPRQASRG